MRFATSNLNHWKMGANQWLKLSSAYSKPSSAQPAPTPPTPLSCRQQPGPSKLGFDAKVCGLSIPPQRAARPSGEPLAASRRYSVEEFCVAYALRSRSDGPRSTVGALFYSPSRVPATLTAFRLQLEDVKVVKHTF